MKPCRHNSDDHPFHYLFILLHPYKDLINFTCQTKVGSLLLCRIRKTCLCNIYLLKPHFYIEKLGYAGVYLFFLFLLQNIDCGYSSEPPHRGGSNLYPQSMFWAKIRKISTFFCQKFSFFTTLKISVHCMGVFS